MEAPMPLPVARSHVRQTKWRRLSLLPELHARRRAARESGRAVADLHLEFGDHAANAPPAWRRPWGRNRCLFALLHHHSAPGSGDRQPDLPWADGAPPAPHRRAFDLPFQAARPPAAPAQKDGIKGAPFIPLAGVSGVTLLAMGKC